MCYPFSGIAEQQVFCVGNINVTFSLEKEENRAVKALCRPARLLLTDQATAKQSVVAVNLRNCANTGLRNSREVNRNLTVLQMGVPTFVQIK